MFLDSNTIIETTNKVNVILSPEFYWVRIFDLPVKNQKDALNLLPTLFEDFIDVDTLKFQAIKQKDGKFLSFAYSEEKIVDALKNSGLNTNQVNNIYFGETELRSFFTPDNNAILKIKETYVCVVDDIMVQLPNALVGENYQTIDLSEVIFSKNKIALNFYSKYIDKKTSYTLSIVLLLFALLNFVKIGENYNSISKLEKGGEKIKSDFGLPATSIQTNSILKKLHRTQKEQIQMRTLISYIFKYHNKKESRMISFVLKDGFVELQYLNSDPKDITKYLEKKYTLKSAVVKDNIVTIGLKL